MRVQTMVVFKRVGYFYLLLRSVVRDCSAVNVI